MIIENLKIVIHIYQNSKHNPYLHQNIDYQMWNLAVLQRMSLIKILLWFGLIKRATCFLYRMTRKTASGENLTDGHVGTRWWPLLSNVTVKFFLLHSFGNFPCGRHVARDLFIVCLDPFATLTLTCHWLASTEIMEVMEYYCSMD